MSKDFILTTKKQDTLRITAYGVENLNLSPCLIFVHGFKGFKDWGFGPYIGNYFSSKGFFVLSFNFSHNGVGNSLTEFDELDRFAENTFSLELSELSQLIDAYFNGFFGGTSNIELGLLGHSRGGGISILTARQKAEVSSVAVWSTVSNFNRYSKRQKEIWRKKGVFEVMNSRTKQIMKLNISLLIDLEQNSDKLNIKKAVKELNKPFLMVHGEQDLAVPVKEAEDLYSVAGKQNTELFLVPSAGHTFDIKHPFEGTNDRFEVVLEKTYQFFNQNLH
ncbi:MAG TPA: prolyl oligopeptidase family serine peptidase, partial [Ignavibacteriaceae bacterium]|nr:prolyl oligopeptidase family serine peptidase [Ignavibacteriaceae bacterium]